MLLLSRALGNPRQTLRSVYTSHAVRRWSLITLAVIVAFGLLGFFGGPPLIRHLVQTQLSQALHRPVTVGRIALNPYTLNLEVDQLRIGEPAGAPNPVPALASTVAPTSGVTAAPATAAAVPPTAVPFFTVGKLVVRPSWSALFRLKPVINEVYLEAPVLHLVRTAAQRFNFSDLADEASQPGPKDSKPALFSVSNIHVEAGRIDFDDEVLQSHHTIDQWRLGIPFIANLPSQADIFVQPLLQARIDGSQLTITGKTKPFSSTLDSTIEIDLDRFDLTRLLPYVPYAFPNGAPVKLQQGQLSSRLGVAFSRASDQASVKLSGSLDLQNLNLMDRQGAALFAVRLIHLDAAQIEPLRGIVHLSQLQIDEPAVTLARDAQGTLNIAQTFASAPGAPAASASQPASASATDTASAPAPFDLAIQQFALTGGRVQFDDHAVNPAAQMALKDINLKLTDFSTLSKNDTRYTAQTGFDSGGTFNSEGTFNLPAHRASAKLTLSQFALPALQPWLNGNFNGQIADGKLAADATLQTDWSAPAIALTVAPAVVDLTALRVQSDAKSPPLLELKQAHAQLTQFDLASHQIDLAALTFDALALHASRDKAGVLNLAALLPSGSGSGSPAHESSHAPRPLATVAPDSARHVARHAARTTQTTQTAGTTTSWHYKIGVLSLKDGDLNLSDLATTPAVALKLAPLQVKISQISDALDRPWQVEASGTFNKKGGFSTQGSVTAEPLAVAMHLSAKNLDMAAFEPYFGAHLNAAVASALFSANGDLKLARPEQNLQAAYDGDASLNDVRMLDRASADLFAGWSTLNVARIKARYDMHGPDLEVGTVSLSNFYARVILDQNGRLNLSNLVAQPAQPAASLTRADAAAADAASAAAAAKAAAASAAAAASTPATTPVNAKPPLNMRFGQFLLQRGRINYTDNFIKPNFTANLVNIGGKIGSFGTRSTQAAPIDLKGSLDGRGPLSISGTVNPLIANPELDLTASASGIELTSFTPYSTKYAGYPITEGRLNVDLHYQLANNQLTANNHIFIDQLTFGDQVQNSTATHLPVRLAIALLKNSRGQIDINVPVSGSLSDPQFSVGGLIWSAFVNLIEKAVTAPFTLLASAFGGSEQLQYVEFAPGSSTLSADAQKKLETLAKAMVDKPAVKLDLIGRADPAQDGPGLKRLDVESAVRQQKVKDLIGHGESISLSDVKVSPDEYDKYLTRAYKAADFKKPRNLIGLEKTLPAPEMTAALEENTPVDDAALRELAQARVAAVHQFLEGKVAPDRLYDRSPHLDASGITDKGATTRVDFVLK